jgi:hypothetical protein
MASVKVFFVHLRRPKSMRKAPHERRDDPFYEFGSFGCTGCHSATLLSATDFHSRHARALEGARLAFIQGGPLGHRLVFLTPPITVKVWRDCCEAQWPPGNPPQMPFKYAEAPIIAYNHGPSDFPLVEKFARDTKRTSIEGGLSSKFRSPVHPVSEEMGREIIAVYEGMRAEVPSTAFATTYEEALPWPPPVIDRNREATYERHIARLAGDANGGHGTSEPWVPVPESQAESHCGVCRPAQSERQRRRCT